jgi:hypothetical protein
MNYRLLLIVQRSVYKDLVCLLREDRLLTLEELKEKVCENFVLKCFSWTFVLSLRNNERMLVSVGIAKQQMLVDGC